MHASEAPERCKLAQFRTLAQQLWEASERAVGLRQLQDFLEAGAVLGTTCKHSKGGQEARMQQCCSLGSV